MEQRKYFITLPIFLVGLILIGRLFYLQIYNTTYTKLSQSNAVKMLEEYPKRGEIYDRNGKILVSNQPSYNIMLVPRELKVFDTLGFCKLTNITKEQLKKRIKKAKKESWRKPSVIIENLTKAEYAWIQEKIYNYTGFYIQERSLRYYHTKYASNVLGYIGEVNDYLLKKKPQYKKGDFIGIDGVEKQYEDILKGKKGIKYVQRDKYNRTIGKFSNGIYDTLPVHGKDLVSTIDIDLQKYAQDLFQHKRGGLVALQPKTGEILALVTAPSYDPSDLVGRVRSKNFTRMYYDSIAKPLFDRSIQGEYPPGSPFKVINALIALQENVGNLQEEITCKRGYYYGKKNIRLGCHHHDSPLALIDGIANSCNAYFATIYRRIIEKYKTPQEGIERWKQHVASFGLGQYLGNDLPKGRPGKVPDSKLYNRYYQYPKYKWYATATISNAIGQGEVLCTPMQMANMTAAIANKGYFYTPHIVKEIDRSKIKDPKFTQKRQTTIDSQYFEPIIEGMHKVYLEGTAKSLQVEGIVICGKTGTAENFTRINGKRVQLTDHSVFVAFAPKEDPQIAICVFVENGYWGSRYAGKMASLVIEKYLTGDITRTDLEKWINKHSLEAEYKKPYSGKPFIINQ